MRFTRLVAAVTLAAATAACGGDDAGNVMAPEGNKLDPAQIDAALGPEVTANDGNMAVSEVTPVDGATGNESGAIAADEAPAINTAAED